MNHPNLGLVYGFGNLFSSDWFPKEWALFSGKVGFGYTYYGWKVGSLDAGYYLSSLQRGPPRADTWKAGLTILSDPHELLRLELLDNL